MSREANLMRDWQQHLIDERGGADGQNYGSLVLDMQKAHEGIEDSTKSNYSPIRGVRAVVQGALGFEAFCQDALITEGFEPQPEPATKALEIVDSNIHLPPQFEVQAASYLAAFQMRARQDPLPPSLESIGFRFYECAYNKIFDPYWQVRKAAKDGGSHDTGDIEKLLGDYSAVGSGVHGLFRENVTSALDILMAFGVSLCRANGRPCEPEELTDFIAGNIDVADDLASVTREQRRQDAKAGIPPFGYGWRVLQGDQAALSQQYVKAIEADNGKQRGQWCATSLRNGSWAYPGYCPASDRNRLRPRADEEAATAIERSLGTVGLSRLIADGTIPSGQLVIAKALEVAEGTIFQELEWQERALAVQA